MVVSSNVKNYVVNFDWLKGDAMGTLITNSFLFGEIAAMVTYDDETMDVLTWATKDHHGNFIPGVKLNRVYNYRLSADERHIFKFDIDGVWAGDFNLDEVCEKLYRMFIEDPDINETDWAYLNIRSDMEIAPNVLIDIGERLSHHYTTTFGGELHVAVDNVGVTSAVAVPTIFYTSDENYIIADRKETIVSEGSFGGGLFGNESVPNAIHGTVEADLAELAKAMYRIRRNPAIHVLEVGINEAGITFAAYRDSEGKVSNTLNVPGDKFKLSNK